MNTNELFLSIKEAATGFSVTPNDVLEFIDKGFLKGVKQGDGAYKIAFKDYQMFGQSLHQELLKKVHQYSWERMLEIQPRIQKEVASRFRENSKFILDRAEKAVVLMESIHKIHEPEFNLYEDKCGQVAGFIVYARVISLLHSVLSLLRNAIPAESLILFRPLWEAILLAEYFTFSGSTNSNPDVIKGWFDKDIIVGAGDVRKFLDKENFLVLELTTNAQKAYSKPMHHTYRSIMESHRALSMSGMGTEKVKSFGFDYTQSSVMRDIIGIISALEKLLLFALQGFLICFANILTKEESKAINTEIAYYNLDELKRLDSVFANVKVAVQKPVGIFAAIHAFLLIPFKGRKIRESV